MALLSSILEVFAVWANKTFIEMPRRLLHVKDGRPEIVSGPVGMDLFEARLHLRQSAPACHSFSGGWFICGWFFFAFFVFSCG
jgi:hypothetical protein